MVICSSVYVVVLVVLHLGNISRNCECEEKESGTAAKRHEESGFGDGEI